MAKAGIKRIINGPFTFSPDGNPLVGPIQGLKNYWVACAVMAGFSQGGGVGLALSQWMVEGDPGFDVWARCGAVRRMGDPRLHQCQGPGELCATPRSDSHEELPRRGRSRPPPFMTS